MLVSKACFEATTQFHLPYNYETLSFSFFSSLLFLSLFLRASSSSPSQGYSQFSSNILEIGDDPLGISLLTATTFGSVHPINTITKHRLLLFISPIAIDFWHQAANNRRSVWSHSSPLSIRLARAHSYPLVSLSRVDFPRFRFSFAILFSLIIHKNIHTHTATLSVTFILKK